MRDRGIFAIYAAIAILAAVSLVALYLAVRPEGEYAPLTLEVSLDEGPVSIAGGVLPVSVEICNTSDAELLVSGESTYVERGGQTVAGLSASVVTAPNSCQTLDRGLPLGEGMKPGLWNLNIVVSVVDKDGRTQALNQRTPNFEVSP